MKMSNNSKIDRIKAGFFSEKQTGQSVVDKRAVLCDD